MSLDYDTAMRQRYDEAEVCRHGYRAESCGKCQPIELDATPHEPIPCLHGPDGEQCETCRLEAMVEGEMQEAALVNELLRRVYA